VCDDVTDVVVAQVRFDKMGSLSAAIELCKTGREMGWAVIIGCGEEGPETTDTFIADFAVGIGAAQFMGGGLHSSETAGKYNRLLEISRENEGIKFIGSKFRR
jgi:enolase